MFCSSFLKIQKENRKSKVKTTIGKIRKEIIKEEKDKKLKQQKLLHKILKQAIKKW